MPSACHSSPAFAPSSIRGRSTLADYDRGKGDYWDCISSRLVTWDKPSQLSDLGHGRVTPHHVTISCSGGVVASYTQHYGPGFEGHKYVYASESKDICSGITVEIELN